MAVEPVRIAGVPVEVSVPARAGLVAGIAMAGFRGRAASPIELQVVPYPALTVFIDFGDVRLMDDGGVGGGQGVVGLGSAGVRGAGLDVDLLQVRLSPVVAHGVLEGAPGLGGTVAGLEEFWGGDAARVRERMHAAGSWEQRFAIVSGEVMRRRDVGRTVDPEVEFAWGRIMNSRGRIRVEQLAVETGWSRKRLWARFRAQVGMTPKRAAQLVRFDRAAHLLARGDSAAAVAADCGYADQSHLHRDVMAFAGLTPSALAVAPWLSVDPIAWASNG
ncbi:helix-turn-helix domain-containing protein [Nocardia sp. NBC_00511]|uniref:helix-turn-helix domain-containing protein n=1 Tax=Nocardia sp. NBC_00511 TaxID=2903591 RepID=UPI0030DDF1C9